jgi:hypothetical protein
MQDNKPSDYLGGKVPQKTDPEVGRDMVNWRSGKEMCV